MGFLIGFLPAKYSIIKTKKNPKTLKMRILEQKFPFSCREQSPGAAGTGFFGRRGRGKDFFFGQKNQKAANKANCEGSAGHHVRGFYSNYSSPHPRKEPGAVFSSHLVPGGAKIPWHGLKNTQKRGEKLKKKKKNKILKGGGGEK